MTMNLIDLHEMKKEAVSDLTGLQSCLLQIVGEPFQFARVSYGDELTLHFGALKPPKSPKLMKEYGTYILGVRGSPWLIKSGTKPQMISADVNLLQNPTEFGTLISKEALEANPLIQPGSHVAGAIAFVVKPTDGIGLQISFSDGSTLHILPDILDEIDSFNDNALPELSDWELLTPTGLLSAGPGLVWSYKSFAATAN